MDHQRFPRNGWFRSLAPALAADLSAAGRLRNIGDGEAVYHAGDDGDGIYAVVEGEIRLIGQTEAGRRMMYLIAGPGHWFGEMSVLDGLPRPQDALGFGTSRVLHVPLWSLHRIAAARTDLGWALGQLVCVHQRAAISYIEQALARPTVARLARILLDYARPQGRETDGGAQLAVGISQADLASMLGVSRGAISVHLGRLANAGAIERGYARLVLTNRPLLVALATR